jgi:hypothetical protein
LELLPFPPELQLKQWRVLLEGLLVKEKLEG